MPAKKSIYWDACVILSYLNQHPDRFPTLEQILEEMQCDKDKIIVTSTLTQVEVSYLAYEKAQGDLDQAAYDQIRAFFQDSSIIELVEAHADIALRAQRLIRDALARGLAIKPYDALHFATAEWSQVQEMQTYDGDILKFDQVFKLPVVIPYVEQKRLPFVD